MLAYTAGAISHLGSNLLQGIGRVYLTPFLVRLLFWLVFKLVTSIKGMHVTSIRMRVPILAAVLSFAALSTGCDSNPVGNKCLLGLSDAGVDGGALIEAQVTSPALNCVSRLCLSIPVETGVSLPGEPLDEGTGLCTGECSKDSDCDRVSVSPCQTGFVCDIPMSVGPFCCKRMCMCKDFINVPDAGRPIPPGCDPDNPDNTCCNLPGRGECAPI